MSPPPRPFRLLVVDDMEAMRLALEDCLRLSQDLALLGDVSGMAA